MLGFSDLISNRRRFGFAKEAAHGNTKVEQTDLRWAHRGSFMFLKTLDLQMFGVCNPLGLFPFHMNQFRSEKILKTLILRLERDRTSTFGSSCVMKM
jgi:hypothetical protein